MMVEKPLSKKSPLQHISRFLTHMRQSSSIGTVEDDGIAYQAKITRSHTHITISSLMLQSRALPMDEADENVKPLDIGHCLITEKEEKESLFIANLDSRTVIARTLDIQLTKEKDIEQAYRYQLEPELPYPLEESMTSRVTLSKENSTTKILCFSCRKKDIESKIIQFNAFNLDPDILCPKVIGLHAFAKQFLQEQTSCILIDICHQETTCLLLYNHEIIAAHTIPQGLSHIHLNDDEIAEAALAETDSLRNPIFQNLHIYLRELSRVLLHFDTQVPSGLKRPICFTGPVVMTPDIIKVISLFLSREALDAETALTLHTVQTSYSKPELAVFAASIGLALVPETTATFMNFRKEELRYKHPWRRWKKPLIQFALVVFLGTICIQYTFTKKLEYKRNQLFAHYEQLVHAIEKSPQDIDKGFNDTGYKNSFNALLDRLEYIEDKELPQKEHFPLHPDIPTVSDLLTWLCSHPIFTSELSATNTPDEKTTKIKKLTYTLVKNPNFERPKERYQVRVEIELSSSNPTLAKALYESLVTPNTFVDSRNEVKWSQNKGKYLVSFMLKDKTKYLD